MVLRKVCYTCVADSKSMLAKLYGKTIPKVPGKSLILIGSDLVDYFPSIPLDGALHVLWLALLDVFGA
eukprot:9229737-Karenia_brevis.AAC.1